MKTQDIFKSTSSKRLNENLHKVFGKRIKFEAFDLDQLHDARNKLRTQVSQVRNESGFNETIENEALTQAQWMLDAINAEIAERAEHIISDPVNEVDSGFGSHDGGGQDGEKNGVDKNKVLQILKSFDENMNEVGGYGDPDQNRIMAALSNGDVESAIDEVWNSYADQDGGELRNMDSYIEDLQAEFEDLAQGGGNPLKHVDNPTQGERDAAPDVDRGNYSDRAAMLRSAEAGGRLKDESLQNEAYINNADDAINLLAALRKQSKMAERGQGDPVRPNQLVNDLWDVMQWIEANMKESIETESVTTGEDMTKLHEGEIQQASAIVTAKTMVDRVGRWIEELSGMENDTLLQLGDSIRDEMGQEQAKTFIETVAPAIQSALENLKSARETLSTGVRALTGEEQPAEMLGADPAASGEEDLAAVEPDAMNPDEVAGDEFGAADAATGGMETAGREQRESIDRSSRLLKVLAG